MVLMNSINVTMNLVTSPSRGATSRSDLPVFHVRCLCSRSRPQLSALLRILYKVLYEALSSSLIVTRWVTMSSMSGRC